MHKNRQILPILDTKNGPAEPILVPKIGTFFYKEFHNYRTEENFGGKKLWRIW